MAASALIKFTQGPNVGPDGEALIGEIGTDVHLSNVDNTDVASWRFDLMYVDPGSALYVDIGPDFDSGDSSTPATQFTPDVSGSYRWVLNVWDAPGQVGDPSSVDIRVFSVAEANGLIVPPPQLWPVPLPDPRSDDPTAKPNEMNFGGQPFGWAGVGGDGLQGDMVRVTDELRGRPAIPVPGPGHTPSPLTAVGLDTPVAVFSLQGRVWVVCPGDPERGKYASIVRLTLTTFVPDFVVYAPTLGEFWRNAVAVSGTVVGDCNLCVLVDRVSDSTRYLLMINVDPTRALPVSYFEYWTVGPTPTPDPVIHPSYGYFRYRDQRAAPVLDPQGPPSTLLFVSGVILTVDGDGAVIRDAETMAGNGVAPSDVDMADAKAIGVAYDPDGTHYGDDLPRLFILSEGWSTTLGYCWQLESHETQFFTLDQRALFNFSEQEAVFQLIYANNNLYVAGYGFGNGPPLRRINPVTLVSQAAATTLTARQVAAVIYDAGSAQLFTILQTLYQDPLVAAALNPLTLAVVAERPVSFNVPGFLSDLHPMVDSVTQQWLVPLYTAYLDATQVPALLAGTAEDMAFLLPYRQRGVLFAPEAALPPRDPYTVYVAASDASGDGTISSPFSSVQQALNYVASHAASESVWRIALGPGVYAETSLVFSVPASASLGLTLIVEGVLPVYGGSTVTAFEFLVTTALDYTGWVQLTFLNLTADGLDVSMTMAPGSTALPGYSLISQNSSLGDITLDAPGAFMDVSLIGTSIVDQNSSFATASASSVVITGGNSTVRLHGSSVYSGVEAAYVTAQDALIGNSIIADVVTFRRSGLYYGGTIAATTVYIDNTALEYMLTWFTEFSATTELVPVGQLVYQVPAVAHTGDVGATLIDNINASGWPQNTAFTVKARMLVYAPGRGSEGTYLEAVGLYRTDLSGPIFLGDAVVLTMNGQGPALIGTCRIVFSVTDNQDITLVCEADEGDSDLFWRGSLEFSFVRGVV